MCVIGATMIWSKRWPDIGSCEYDNVIINSNAASLDRKWFDVKNLKIIIFGERKVNVEIYLGGEK